jgi:hypothetical protein
VTLPRLFWHFYNRFLFQYLMYTKVVCSSSNLTCTNLKCRVKPVSRVVGHFNLQCNLERPVRNIIGSFSVYHQTLLGGNFNNLFSYKNLEICNLENLCNTFPLLKPFVKFGNISIFNGLLKQCPYGPGLFSIVNATMKPEISRDTLGSIQIFPNGIFRLEFKINNKRDDNILSFSLCLKNNFRKNTLETFEQF